MEVYSHSGLLGTLLLVFTAYTHRPRVARQGVPPTAEPPRVLAHPPTCISLPGSPTPSFMMNNIHLDL